MATNVKYYMTSNQKKSFIRGFSSIASIYPATAANRTFELQSKIITRSAEEAIAQDMARVGADIKVASEKFALDVNTYPTSQRSFPSGEQRPFRKSPDKSRD